MRIILRLSAATIVWACLSLAWADDQPPLANLNLLMSQYKAANQAKYANLPVEAQQAFADVKQMLEKKMSHPGLKVGAQAPDFSLRNAFGTEVTLSDLRKQGPVIVTFYRGAWCPFCNIQLQAYQKAMPVFKQYGASMVAITPQKPDRSVRQLKERPLDFEVLSDLDSQVMKDYELHFMVPEALYEAYKKHMSLDLAEYNGEGRYELPIPGTFVVDQEGIIRAKFADPDYTKRMEPRDIMEALSRLQSAQPE